MSSYRTIRLTDDGILVVNGVHMSGVVESVSVNGQMILQEQTLLLTSGKEKTFNGFDDASVKIGMTLTEDEDGGHGRYDKLKLLNNAFKTLRSEQPITYLLEGLIFKALDIKGGLFRGLSVDADNTDGLSVTVTIVEATPPVALVQRQQQAAGPVTVDTTPASPGMSKADVYRLQRAEGMYR